MEPYLATGIKLCNSGVMFLSLLKVAIRTLPFIYSASCRCRDPQNSSSAVCLTEQLHALRILQGFCSCEIWIAFIYLLILF